MIKLGFVLLIAVILVQGMLFWKYQRQVKDICRQLSFLMKHDSNMLITREMDFGGIGELADVLNEWLELKRREKKEYLKKEEMISDTYTNLSHDIRTPMNVILGYAQLMENELKGKDLPETSEHLKKLQQSGNLLLSIINNVLDMARIESGRMEIDENYGRIEDIRQTLFEIFEDEAKKKKIALHYTIKVEHEHVLTDVTKVKEILVNILSNAIKYTPTGGSVMVNIEELPCDEPGYMSVRTRVSDTGVGMSQDYLSKIFEAFTR